MTLPTSFLSAFFLFLLAMICWGSWANTFKMAGKWRFELYYAGYSFGVLLAASIAALTLGTFGTELSFMDNLAVTGRRQIGYGLLAGGLFNLGNLLFVAAISIAGMAAAFPPALGLALIMGALWDSVVRPQGNNPAVLFSGVALVLLAIVFVSMAYRQHHSRQLQNEGKKVKSPLKGIIVSLVSGLLMGAIYPLLDRARGGDIGLGPYPLAFCLAAGMFLTTPVYSIYFMNLPVHGKPIEFGELFKGTARQHLLGVLGGVLWAVSAIAYHTAGTAPMKLETGLALISATEQGAVLIGVLSGLLLWKEFQNAQGAVRTQLAMMLLLLAAGGTLISVAPLFVR